MGHLKDSERIRLKGWSDYDENQNRNIFQNIFLSLK
jgi:hypothetical protein